MNEREYKTELVQIIPLTDFTEVRVSRVLNEAGETEAIDIRQWYGTQKEPEKRPTQKGIRVGVDKFKNLMEVLNSL